MGLLGLGPKGQRGQGRRAEGYGSKGQGSRPKRESDTQTLALYLSICPLGESTLLQTIKQRQTHRLSLSRPPPCSHGRINTDTSKQRERETHTQLLCPGSPNGPTLIQTVNRERHTERCSPCQCTRRPKEAPGGPRGPNEPKKLHNHGDRDRAQLRHTYQTSNDNIMKP